MAGSAAVNKIVSVQSLVARAEAGDVPWSEIILQVDTSRDLVAGEDTYEFATNLYCSFRSIEAVAYVYRDKHRIPLKLVIRELVAWARRQREVIEQKSQIEASYVPKSGRERLGQESFEEKCRWALRLIDESFPAWGY